MGKATSLNSGDPSRGSGGVYEVDKTSAGTVTGTKTYYPAAGAMRINNTLYYTIKDHLGSTSVVTDSTGVVVGKEWYYPYGETRFTSGTLYTDKLFTGQRDVGLGIYDFHARMYDPKIGRFLSLDSIVPGMANPQAYNRYSYTLNNPLRYTDPTGHMVADDGDYCHGCTLPPPVIICSSSMCNPNGGGGNGGNDDGPSIGPGPAPTPDLISNYCGDINGLACLANFAQDIATLTDIVGVGLIETPVVAVGCFEGGPLGCAIAEIGVIATWNLTLNIVEQYASGASFVLTVADDVINK